MYRRRFLVALLGVMLSITVPFIYRKWQSFRVEKSKPPAKCLSSGQILYTAESLATHTGPPSILLAFLGIVYNVTAGHYYHPGGSYGFFSGKDGTRAFLTGEFTAKELRDDIADLDDSYLNGIETWIDLYEDKYPRVGVVVGTYYDQDGCPTEQSARLKRRLERLKRTKREQQDEIGRYPPCNSQWDVQTKSGKVWCTNLSGGIARQWVGRPRLFYDLHEKTWRCACVADDDHADFCDGDDDRPISGMQYSDTGNSGQPKLPDCRFKYYDGCTKDSIECSIKE